MELRQDADALGVAFARASGLHLDGVAVAAACGRRGIWVHLHWSLDAFGRASAHLIGSRSGNCAMRCSVVFE